MTVLFDADCGLCTAVARRLRRSDRSGRLRLVPLQRAASAGGAVARLAAARDLRRQLHVVDADGRWAAGGDAMLRILGEIPSLRPLARLGRLPLVYPFVAPTYALIARYRGAIGRAVDAAACRLPGHTS